MIEYDIKKRHNCNIFVKMLTVLAMPAENKEFPKAVFYHKATF